MNGPAADRDRKGLREGTFSFSDTGSPKSQRKDLGYFRGPLPQNASTPVWIGLSPTFEDGDRSMRITMIGRLTFSLLFLMGMWTCQAQSRALCLYNESFPAGGLPSGWVGLPAEVERLDADGNGTGAFVAPWQVGDALQANAAGYFPVPDEPVGNTFAMANDDAAPCDCAMNDLSLFSPFFDLTAATAPAVTYRVYHDGRPFNGQASLWASPDGSSWTQLEEIPAALGIWQQRTADLGAFAGGTVQLRLRYSDAGHWASGVGLDDLCVFERVPDDIALSQTWLGDITASSFNTSVRSLGYARMPFEQQTPLRLSARIRNNGTSAASTVRIHADIAVGGDPPTTVITTVAETLAPLKDTLVTWETGFMADGPGAITITLTAEALSADEEPSDNSAGLGYVVTSAGVGNNAMALDNDLGSSVCGTDSGFSAGCRYELTGDGSIVQGISVRFGAGTAPGSRVHALLMDATLNLLSSSASHTVSDEDLALSFSGGSVYIPLDSAYTVTGDQDVLALVRCLPDSGALRVASGGAVPEGGAFLIETDGFLISYPTIAPIVRLHFSEPVTGLSGDQTGYAKELVLSPNPATEGATIHFGQPLQRSAAMVVCDVRGQHMASRMLPPGTQATWLDTSGWPSGIYMVRFSGLATVRGARLVVGH